jgi:leader peptidase (prepilin peptidase) / N-methyltransferase
MEAFSILIAALLAALLGWIAGALINYFSDVLPARRKLVRPFCLHCQSPIDIVSYWAWPRRCKVCGRMRSPRAWLVYGIAAGISVLMWATIEQRWAFFAVDLLVVAYFGLVAVIDIEHRLILHSVSLVGAALGLGVGIGRHGFLWTILGGLAGFVAMMAFYFLGIGFIHLLTRLQGKPIGEDEALGFGDVNLGVVVGLFLGWPGILAGLVLAILLGGVVSLIYLLLAFIRRAYRPGLALPYGPFLSASAVILLYFKDMLFK